MKLIARYTLLLIILISGVVLCFAQESNSSPSVALSATQGKADLSQTFTSLEGGFTIALPEKPSDQRTQPTPAGNITVDTHLFVWVTPQAEYLVMYMETPKVLEDSKISKAILDDARNNAIKQENGKLLNERDLSLGGHVGREFKIESSKGMFVDRVYLVKQRMYLIAAYIPTAKLAGEVATSKILDSFKFIGEKSAVTSISTPATQSNVDLGQMFSSIEGGFTIALPSKPSEQRTEPVADGRLTSHIFDWATSSGEYTVSYMETPRLLEDPTISKAILDNARDNGIKKENGKLLSERDLNLDGHVGREFKIAASDGVFIDRVYLVKQRFYSLTAFIPSAKLADEAAAIKILDSFKLIERKETAVK